MEIVRVPQHVHTTFFEGNTILLDSRRNIYYALNGSASDFWKMLIESNSLKEALLQIVDLYEHQSENLNQDMQKFVLSLVDLGLLESQSTG